MRAHHLDDVAVARAHLGNFELLEHAVDELLRVLREAFRQRIRVDVQLQQVVKDLDDEFIYPPVRTDRAR